MKFSGFLTTLLFSGVYMFTAQIISYSKTAILEFAVDGAQVSYSIEWTANDSHQSGSATIVLPVYAGQAVTVVIDYHDNIYGITENKRQYTSWFSGYLIQETSDFGGDIFQTHW